mmetsp:Transcript_59455/g.138487  ORF Transcript_59455/g.138487 Transcript_59455/m.138487 type:complete len:653 (+) Transcript_59455:67-2025(+)
MDRVGVVARHLCSPEPQVGRLVPEGAAAAAVFPQGKSFVTEPTQRLARYQGSGSSITPARTFPEVFKEKVRTHPKLKALAQKRGARDGPWTFWTWQEYLHEVQCTAKAFIALSCEQHGAVSILGFNSPEWYFAAVGAIFAGLTPAGIYTTNGPDAVQYIINHSKSQVLFVDSNDQLQKILAVRSGSPQLKTMVHWGADCPPEGSEPGLMSWTSFLSGVDRIPDATLNARLAAQHPDNAFYLSYTSGTTGNPKAVMYSHDNVLWSFKYISKIMFDQAGSAGLDEREVSYMPLSHIAGNVQLLGAVTKPLSSNSCVYFAFPDAMQGSLPVTLKEVKPTLFTAVPRVWEKFHLAMQQALRAQPTLKQNPKGLKAILGLDEVKCAQTGAAPIATSLMEFFESIGLPIYEIYGMTENAAYSHFAQPGRRRIGSVGPALTDEGANAKLAPGTNEICTWSRGVMMGYMYDPQKTAEAFDDEGFLRTGDIGEVDADGFTYVTGRIKELIITAGGENCAPVLLEEAIKQQLPAVSNCVMIGDRQKYLIALLTLKLEPDGRGSFTNQLAPEALAVDPKCKTVQDAMQSEVWKQYIQKGIDAANEVAISRAQTTRKWTLLSGDFVSVGQGAELTPTMKLRREVVRKKYEGNIKDAYGKDFAGL